MRAGGASKQLATIAIAAILEADEVRRIIRRLKSAPIINEMREGDKQFGGPDRVMQVRRRAERAVWRVAYSFESDISGDGEGQRCHSK